MIFSTLVDDLSVIRFDEPVRRFTKVVLPAPFGPITPRTSPLIKLKLTSTNRLNAAERFAYDFGHQAESHPLMIKPFPRVQTDDTCVPGNSSNLPVCTG